MIMLTLLACLGPGRAFSVLPQRKFDGVGSVIYAGFGKKVVDGGSSGSSSNTSSLSRLCPCGADSKTPYSKCCGILHGSDMITNDARTMVRARFSAFATGNADYLIDTTHYKHKDYARFRDSLDPEKSRKRWKKEIITQNTNLFEFLKLELQDEPVVSEEVSNKLMAYKDATSVTFNVLVRQKSDKGYISFQETSIFTPRNEDTEKNHVLGTGQNLFYCEAVVSALQKSDNERLLQGVGYQTSGSSIKDKW